MDAVEVDGSRGEGGGQVLRLAVALSAATGRAVRVANVRANRERPGLAAQHAAAVRAVAALCGARTEGVEVGSRTVAFAPARPVGGEASVEVGTAGSVSLVLQAALGALSGASAGGSRLSVGGGTDVIRAPSWDYLVHVLLPALARAGMQCEATCERRGFYPTGGGRVTAALPSRGDPLRPLAPSSTGAARIEGSIVWSGLPDHVPQRIDHAIRKGLLGRDVARITRTRVDASCPGVVATVWADLGGAVVGASMVGRRGLLSEEIGSALATEVAADIDAGATVDAHLLDQLVPCAAMAGGTSVLRARGVSLHASTALEVAAAFVPLEVGREESEGTVALTIAPG